MPPIPEPPPNLSDGVIALRLAAERDIPEILIAYQDDPHLHARLGQQRPPSGAELGRRQDGAEAQRRAGRGVVLTVLEHSADVCIGEVRAHHFEWFHQRAELDVWLAPGVRGRGLGVRALRLAAGWLFEACRLERLGVIAQPDNEPMLATARAAGFLLEGRLREYARERRGRADRAVLSLLPEELPA